jgi:hypothetical protein
MVWADFGTSAKEVAASWLTVPEKMMLDFEVSAALPVDCGAAAFMQPQKANKTVAMNTDEIFMVCLLLLHFRACSCVST